jgi:predicted secreted protein
MCTFALFASCVSTRFASDEKTIQLKGNPTTGYNWFYQISDESVIAVEEYVKYLGDDMVVGAPSMFTYTITSLKPGQATLHFEYKRPWETVEPIETKEYIITVDEKGKIKIEE